MSDAKPFAEVDRGDEDDGEDPTMTIGGILTVSKHEDDSHEDAVADFERDAAKINAAVARARREAAAEALEWAAKRCRQVIEDMSRKARTAYTDGYLEALRVEAGENADRAAALRKGEA